MKYLLQMVMRLVNAKSPSAEECYLAQSTDAYDFEIRVQSLERIRG
ncbi:MAG: hypothetical protein WCH60_00915 [Burkholderiales bacterium]